MLCPPRLLLLQQAQALHDSMGLAEALAQWTVESWAIALGIPVVAVPMLNSLATGLPHQTATPPAGLQSPAELLKLAKLRHEQAKQDNQQVQRQLEIMEAWQSNTKIGRHGEHLPVTATSWAAVLDAKTRLMWAVNPTVDDGFPNPIEKMCWDDAMAWPEAVNAVGWCEHHDWRLPTDDELETLLIHEKQQGLHILRDRFPDITSEDYYVWTSSPYAYDGANADLLHFLISNSNTDYCYKGGNRYARVVRSVQ